MSTLLGFLLLFSFSHGYLLHESEKSIGDIGVSVFQVEIDEENSLLGSKKAQLEKALEAIEMLNAKPIRPVDQPADLADEPESLYKAKHFLNRTKRATGDQCGGVLTPIEGQWQWHKVSNVVGNGKYATADRNNPSTCTWTIDAPGQLNMNMLYSIKFVGFDGNKSALCYDNCWYGGVKVKGTSEIDFCCPTQYNQFVRSISNQLTVTVTNIYRYTDFQIQYMLDPCSDSMTVCSNGGVPNPFNCNVCRCLPGFIGNDCSQREGPSGGANCGGTRTATPEWQWQKVNNVLGNGKYAVADVNNPAKCTWHITTSAELRIEYDVNFVGFDGNDNALCKPNCVNGGLVASGHTLYRWPEGIRFCCHNDYNQKRRTGQNLLQIQAFNAYRYTDFQIGYRSVIN